MKGWTIHGMLAVVAVVVACDVTEPESREIILWDAVIQPEEAGVAGSAAAISRQRATEVSIGLDDIPEDATLRWGIFTGACAEPGELLGAWRNYPTLSGSTRSGEGVIGIRLESDETYHVAVLQEEGGERLGCGQLAPRGG